MLRDTIPRLSAGRGDGYHKLCAMQSISWQHGDVEITDFPECSSRHLAVLVQYLNDELADPETGYLSAKDGMSVLDLGWLTVGTGNAGHEVTHNWFAALLDSPRWGVVRFLAGPDRELCRAVANAHRMSANWHPVQWSNVSVSAVINGKRTPLQSLAMFVVYQLASPSWRAESATRMACHTNYYYGTTKYDWVYWTRTAIEAWRNLQAVTEPGIFDPVRKDLLMDREPIAHPGSEPRA
jgi:hypothetical protein